METLLNRLDARDRALFTRWAIGPAATRAVRRSWRYVTHLGGIELSIAAAALPVFFGQGLVRAAGLNAMLTLAVSHFVVQLIKRSVGRPRPSTRSGCATFIDEPDRFSFPSGHSAAAMAIAVAYGVAFPALAAPLLVVALAVGASRVCLGVHYPGDVVIGQAIAIVTGAIVLAI